MIRFVPVSLGIMMLGGCALLQAEETRYLQTAQNHATQDEVVQQLGRPLLVTVDPHGSAVWVYQIREQDPGNRWTFTGLWCDEYLLTFDDQAILRHWSHKSEFHGGELMPTYCVAGGVTETIAAKAKREVR
jgi:hypothetical protein